MDLHLNLFYSYNQGNELIENNLTRAFIVTLKLLTPITKHKLLHTLFSNLLPQAQSGKYSYYDAKVALQSHIDINKVRQMPERFLLTLASDRIILEEEEGQIDWSSKIYFSIPDGWIFDYQAGWVVLIESKVGINPLNEQQLVSHADKWLGIKSSHLAKHLISANWRDVITAIQQIVTDVDADNLNQQERMLLSEFLDFLGYYGYRKFIGFIWRSLQLPPRFMLRKHRFSNYKRKEFLQFTNLLSAPNFSL